MHFYEQVDILLKNGNDSDNNNTLLLALVIRAGKVSTDDINELDTKLKELIAGKYSNINAIKEHCELSIGLYINKMYKWRCW